VETVWLDVLIRGGAALTRRLLTQRSLSPDTGRGADAERKGILKGESEAASPRPPSWAIDHTEFSVGVLGETAPAIAGRRRALGFVA